MLDQMDKNLQDVLTKENIEFDGYGFGDSVEYFIRYYDQFGRKGNVVVAIDEDNPKYQVYTKRNDDDSIDDHNIREIKSLSAVVKYIRKYTER